MTRMETLTALPASFPSGTTVKYTKTVSDYPASNGWQLKLLLAGAELLSVDAAPSGSDFAVTISATESARLSAGTYQYAEEVSKDGERYRIGSGTVLVEPNLTTALAGELQSADERLLKAVVAVIESRMGTASGSIPKDIEAYSIDGIAVTKVPLERLMAMRTQLATAVARAKRGGGIGRQYRMSFTGARNEQ